MEFATPGKFLGTEEEFVGGDGVYSEGGKLHAFYAGDIILDKQRRISVKTKSVPRMVEPGMIVYGRIEDIFDPIALVKLELVEGVGMRQAQGDYFCVLHVSNVKRGYVKELRDEVRIGDIIKAVVCEVKRGEAYLDMRGADLGVIKAFCSNCRNPLRLKDRLLVCDACGNKESRKLSTEYSLRER
ncbi:MAG: exosome complex RNA-binding protein Csl4 [Candidatus Micrarchaeia archaeon]